MPPRVRSAAADDLAAITALLMEDAAERAQHDGALWPQTSDAAQRIAQTFAEEVRVKGAARWLIAEAAGAVAGVARFGVIPCPPIYHLAGGLALVLFDDTHVSDGAPAGTLPALIAAAEREGAAMGAVIFLAACAPFQRKKLGALQASSYDIVTQYLVKHRLAQKPAPASVRAATADDVPAIVTMGAAAQKGLREANARMWTPHPDAPARFGLWMQHSLSLPDRRILISIDRSGFVIAQPPSAFHLPLAASRDHLGLVDDFWTPVFATATDAQATATAQDLLVAAEQAFVEKGKTSAMVICPAAWPSKQAFLRDRGYGDGNAWLLKT